MSFTAGARTPNNTQQKTSYHFPLFGSQKQSSKMRVLQSDYPAIPAEALIPIGIIGPSATGPWIAGGAPMKWVAGESLGKSDIDVFFASERQYQRVLDFIQYTQFFDVTVVNNNGDEVTTTVNAQSVSSTDNAETFKMSGPQDIEWHVQLIKKDFFPSAEAVIDRFDIRAVKVFTDGCTLTASDITLDDIKNKRLHFDYFTAHTYRRLIKYWAYGFIPTSETLDAIKENDSLVCKFEGGDWYDNAF